MLGLYIHKLPNILESTRDSFVSIKFLLSIIPTNKLAIV